MPKGTLYEQLCTSTKKILFTMTYFLLFGIHLVISHSLLRSCFFRTSTTLSHFRSYQWKEINLQNGRSLNSGSRNHDNPEIIDQSLDALKWITYGVLWGAKDLVKEKTRENQPTNWGTHQFAILNQAHLRNKLIKCWHIKNDSETPYSKDPINHVKNKVDTYVNSPRQMVTLTVPSHLITP